MFTQSTLRTTALAPLSTPLRQPEPADPRAELQLFFKAYDAACLDLDADGVAALYDLPCLASGLHGHGSFTARGELRAHFAKLFSGFRQQGLVSASLASLAIDALSREFARAEAVWAFSNHRGSEVANLASAYTLRRTTMPTGARWRIVHAVALDEAENLKAAKRPVLALKIR